MRRVLSPWDWTDATTSTGDLQTQTTAQETRWPLALLSSLMRMGTSGKSFSLFAQATYLRHSLKTGKLQIVH